MGNIFACFGGQEKSGGGGGGRRKPQPASRRSLPCHHQQQKHQVSRHREVSSQTAALLPAVAKPAALLPAVAKPASPERNSADYKTDHLSCLEKNEQQLFAATCDATSTLDGLKQPSFTGPAVTVQGSPSGSPKKKVTFDLNVKTYDHVPAAAEEDDSEETRQQGEGVPLVKDNHGSAHNGPGGLGYPENNRYKDCNADSDDDGGLFCDLDDEDGGEDDGYEDGDFEGAAQEDEESFDSYFSLKMGKDRVDSNSKEAANDDEAISGSSQVISQLTPVVPNRAAAVARDRSNYINSVLNPVENIAQWKDVKAGRKNVQGKLPPEEKENIHFVVAGKGMPKMTSSAEPQILDQSSNPQKSPQSTSPRTTSAATAASKQEVSVDTSLSSWLTPTQTTNVAAAAKAPSRCSNSSFSQENSYRSNNSFTSLEDRPILGALTVDDIKRTASSSLSPRRSPTKSPDEMPIMGTVGSYWKHTEQEVDSGFARSGSAASSKGIPNSTSKYREDKRVNWHSSPFEARLERALNKGSSPVPSAAC